MPVRLYRRTGIGKRPFMWTRRLTRFRKKLCWYLLLRRGRGQTRWKFGSPPEIQGEIKVMFIIDNYPAAVICCIVTMFCWGSWANTQKLAAGTWRFELFYW